MGGCRCSYKECINTTKSCENLHFFHYPVKNRERCVQWIENTCKPNFYQLEEEQLRNKVVCELHFESKWFLNSQRKRLLQGAIPTIDTQTVIGPNGKPLAKTDNTYPVTDQYQDVKIIPMNDDNTVFLLDTENMFTVSPKIQSFIIKNGTVVSTTPQGYKGCTVKGCKNNKQQGSSDKKMDMPAVYPTSGPSRLINGSANHRPNILKKANDRTITLLNNLSLSDKITDYTAKVDAISNSTKAQAQSLLNDLCATPTLKKALVAQNCLRKIRQNSRDIATIKRMLRKKKSAHQKPDTKKILATLQTSLPPSLYTLVSLSLGEKSDLSSEEIEFFTTLHQSSPDLYRSLSEKYKWSIPDIDMSMDMN